ncbi:MAG: hypothetical protein AB1641_14475 [Thermodesulfobacteriota bacterium]
MPARLTEPTKVDDSDGIQFQIEMGPRDTDSTKSFIKIIFESTVAAVIYTAFMGFWEPSPNIFQVILEGKRLLDPDLFPHDLFYGLPAPAYFPAALYYNITANFIAPVWASVIATFITLGLLFLGFSMLAEGLSGRRIPPLLGVCLLLAGGTHMLAGHHLAFVCYYMQFTTFALGLLAMAFLIKNYILAGTILACFGSLLYPLVGFYFLLGLTGLIILYRKHFLEIRLPLLLCFVTLAAIIIPNSAYVGSDTSAALLTYARVLQNMTALDHFKPGYWGFQEYVNLGLILLFGIIWYKFQVTDPEFKYRLVMFIGGFIGLAALVNTINNHYLISPFLLKLNPLKISPLLLALFYVHLMVFVAERWKQGLIISSALMIFTLNQHVLIYLACFNLIFDLGLKRFDLIARWKSNGGPVFSFMRNMPEARRHDLAAAMLSLPWLGLSFLGSKAAAPVYGLLIVAVFTVAAIWPSRITIYKGVVLVLAGRALLGLWLGQFPAPWYINSGPDIPWLEACATVSQVTRMDEAVIIPPNKWDFQYLTLRPAFASWYLPRHSGQVFEWLERWHDLDILPGKNGEYFGHTVHSLDWAEAKYHALPTEVFERIARKYKFVRYCIVKADQALDLALIYQNNGYRLYRLP